MTEYFRPSKIWVGKLCYVDATIGGSIHFVPCRIASIRGDGVEVVVEHDCVFVSTFNIFDRIDGPTIFHDVHGGKP